MSKAIIRSFKTHMRMMDYSTRDVAKICDVSSAYISAVLRGVESLSPKTVEMVLDRFNGIINTDLNAMEVFEDSMRACMAPHRSNVVFAVLKQTLKNRTI